MSEQLSICPDCEMETNHLVSSTKTCTLCYKRYQNCKSLGKEYKPLVQLKGTKEYNRAMGRRQKAIERKNNINTNTKSEKSSEVNLVKTSIVSIEGYDYIDIDSNKLLETIDYLKSCLDNIPKMEEQVTKMQEEMLVITHKKAETNGPGDPEFEKLNAREYSIIKYRRQIKDALVYLRRIDTNILNDNLIQELDETQRNYEKDEYVPKYARGNKEFTVSVNVGGLHGASQIELFKRHVYAKDETGAKAYVEGYLNNLHGVTIYGKSWSIREVKSNDDI